MTASMNSARLKSSPGKRDTQNLLAVEKEALRHVGDLLGHNVDRNTSRVKNCS